MTDQKPVLRWDDDVLLAALISIEVCEDQDPLIGVTLEAKDGTPFAHGHFDLEVAHKLRGYLDECITALTKRLS